jgi:predicted lipase
MGFDASTNSIITAFRGTTNIRNLVEDFNFLKTSYDRPNCNDCKVHEGFLATYESISEQVLAYLPTLVSLHPDATIVVTGHSLGAAQAMLGAIDQQLQGHDVHFYSYGSPRVGEINWSNYFDSMITAVNMRAVY